MDIKSAWKAANEILKAGGRDELEVAKAWSFMTRCLDPATQTEALNWQYYSAQRAEELSQAMQILKGASLRDDLFDWYLVSVRRAFSMVGKEIELSLDGCEVSEGREQMLAMTNLLEMVGRRIQQWQSPLNDLWPTSYASSAYRKCFVSSLYSVLPPRFAPALSNYLRHLLTSASPVAALSSTHPLASPTLVTILDRYDPLLFALIYERIEWKVRVECKGAFHVPKLHHLLLWLNEGVLDWVCNFYENSLEGGREEAKKMLKPTFSRFEYHIHKTLCSLRTDELFDIIVDYPESKPALEDLKVSLHKTDQRKLLVDRLRASMESRLLHPGAGTRDIISQYVSTIRSLRILDAQGTLLSRVAEPIRKYLRSRDDTIRCIMSSLIDENSDLMDELNAGDGRLVHDSKDECENYNDPKWTPDPVDAPPDFRKSKGSDILQMLVSIYDTKDVFIKELQVLLAQRLLAIKDYVLDREIRNIEILKLRFGESSLQGCEVMIKDMHDSRQIDVHVHQKVSSTMHATVLSRLFWPSFQSTPLKLPGQLGAAQADYDRFFISLKPGKKLRWLPQLGVINMTIDLKDRSITTDATPVQASIMELFSKQSIWSTDDLATELKMGDISLVRNGLFFWNNLNVLKSQPDDTWELLETKDTTTELAVSHVIEEVPQAVQSVESLQIEQMRVYWLYIQGMLRNLGSLPLAQIHSRLSMVVPTYKGKTTDELSAFLEVMRAEGLVEKTGTGSWKIVK